MNKEEYNNIPVYYCKHCLSLGIVEDHSEVYCTHCNGTQIEERSFEDWQQLYKLKYGKPYITKKD